MKKKKTRKFTPDEKYAYHKKRMNDSHISDVQRCYSKHFVDGFLDPNASYNLRSSINEMNSVKEENGGRLIGFDAAFYKGLVNGHRAVLNKNRKMSNYDLSKERKSFYDSLK